MSAPRGRYDFGLGDRPFGICQCRDAAGRPLYWLECPRTGAWIVPRTADGHERRWVSSDEFRDVPSHTIPRRDPPGYGGAGGAATRDPAQASLF